MKIEEACESKGELPGLENMYCLMVRHSGKKIVPCWYEAKTDHFLRHVSGEEAIRDDWQPYHEVKEIMPEKAGELWGNEDGRLLATRPSGIIDKIDIYAVSTWGTEWLRYGKYGWHSEITHNKNGWTRKFPEVEDDSVEIKEVSVIGSGPIDTVLISAKGLESFLHGKDGKLSLKLSQI